MWLRQVRVNEQQVVLWKALITGAPAPCSFGRGAACAGVSAGHIACQQLAAVNGFCRSHMGQEQLPGGYCRVSGSLLRVATFIR